MSTIKHEPDCVGDNCGERPCRNVCTLSECPRCNGTGAQGVDASDGITEYRCVVCNGAGVLNNKPTPPAPTDTEVREAVDFFSNASNFDGRNTAECEIFRYGQSLLSHLAAQAEALAEAHAAAHCSEQAFQEQSSQLQAEELAVAGLRKALAEKDAELQNCRQWKDTEGHEDELTPTPTPPGLPDCFAEPVAMMDPSAEYCEDCEYFEPCKKARVARAPRLTAAHPDDTAVDLFAATMKEKLAQKREEGRSGWQDPARCSVEFLESLLIGHVAKGDPVDIANICMMLWNRGVQGNLAAFAVARAAGIRDNPVTVEGDYNAR